MKYRILSLLLLIMAFSGGFWSNRCTSGDSFCGTKDGPVEKILVDSAFIAFVDSIPIVRLKNFELNSDQDFEHVDLKSKFIPEGAALIGRLIPLKRHEFIIYSYPADIRLPILEVYNANGEKVNQRELFQYDSCPLELGGHHNVKLSEDFTQLYLETYCATALSNRELDTIVIHELIPN